MFTVNDVLSNLSVLSRISEHFHKTNDKAQRWEYSDLSDYTIYNNRVELCIPLEFGEFRLYVNYVDAHVHYNDRKFIYDVNAVLGKEVASIVFGYYTPKVDGSYVMTTGKVSRKLTVSDKRSLAKQLNGLADSFIKAYDKNVMVTSYSDGVNVPYVFNCNRIGTAYDSLAMLLAMTKHNTGYLNFDKQRITAIMADLRLELRALEKSVDQANMRDVYSRIRI